MVKYLIKKKRASEVKNDKPIWMLGHFFFYHFCCYCFDETKTRIAYNCQTHRLLYSRFNCIIVNLLTDWRRTARSIVLQNIYIYIYIFFF